MAAVSAVGSRNLFKVPTMQGNGSLEEFAAPPVLFRFWDVSLFDPNAVKTEKQPKLEMFEVCCLFLVFDFIT